MSNAVKYKKSNHLHTVEHMVQSTFQNMLIAFFKVVICGKYKNLNKIIKI